MTEAERKLLEDIKNEVTSTDCSWADVDDSVHHPKHYQLEGLDCESIDVIRAVLGAEGFRAFCRGNALKYLIRADKKGGEEDLEKALVYLKWEIQN